MPEVTKVMNNHATVKIAGCTARTQDINAYTDHSTQGRKARSAQHTGAECARHGQRIHFPYHALTPRLSELHTTPQIEEELTETEYALQDEIRTGVEGGDGVAIEGFSKGRKRKDIAKKACRNGRRVVSEVGER